MQPAVMTVVREATFDDAVAIRAIHGASVVNSAASFQLAPWTDDAFAAWWDGHGPRHAVLVAVEGGAVLGWGALGQAFPKDGTARTGELTVYIAPDAQGRGLGRLLATALIDRARDLGYHSLVALITGSNMPSQGLFRSLGFVESGRLREVAWKLDGWHDLVYYQLMLPRA